MTSQSKIADLSVAVLSGGASRRMGSDKAFLHHNGLPFIKIITNEMLLISDDVVAVIGKKSKKDFEAVVSPEVRILNDEVELENPLGGMLTACNHLKRDYVTFLACDNPLVKSNVIRFLFRLVVNHSAAIPIWENGNIEPLCAVYNVKETKEAANAALRKGLIGCRNLVSQLHDIAYVKTSDLRRVDPELASLTNVNSKEDFERLKSGVRA